MFEQLLAMRQILRDQKYQSDELNELARERLHAVLISAFEHTAYYGKLMREAGYNPRHDFNGPEDLVNLPILTKQILKERGIKAFVRKADIEFLDDNGTPAAPGQKARIIVTDLSAKLMPFIRYEQGDRAVFAESRFDTGDRRRHIQRIIGRDNDYAILADGTRRFFIPFYEALDVFTELKRFRIVQVEPDLFDILIVADKDYFDGIKTQAVERLKHLAGSAPEYRLHLVEEIPRDPSAKIRMLISNVRQDSHGM